MEILNVNSKDIAVGGVDDHRKLQQDPSVDTSSRSGADRADRCAVGRERR